MGSHILRFLEKFRESQAETKLRRAVHRTMSPSLVGAVEQTSHYITMQNIWIHRICQTFRRLLQRQQAIGMFWRHKYLHEGRSRHMSP